MTQHLTVRGRSIPRHQIPADVSVGQHLVRLATEALGRGERPTLSAVVVSSEEVTLLALPEAGDRHGFLSGLTTVPGTEAVGLMGIAHRRTRSGAKVPALLCFLEWTDCGWWMSEAILDAEGALLAGSVSTRSAQAGDALPEGVGRWWSHARRSGLEARLAVDAPSLQAVH